MGKAHLVEMLLTLLALFAVGCVQDRKLEPSDSAPGGEGDLGRVEALDSAADLADVADLEVVCVADCEGKECGDDGCGGSCGEPCDDGLACTTDACVGGSCSQELQPYFCTVGGACVPEGAEDPLNPCGECRSVDSPEGWSAIEDGMECGAGEVCFNGVCCNRDANCQGKECGDDLCGGVCGECPQHHDCTGNGICEADCEHYCAGKECGTASPGDECDCGKCEDPAHQCMDAICTQDNKCQDVPASGGNCDDGNPCTESDECDSGECVGDLLPPEELEPGECLCSSTEDCEPLEDGNVCNGTLYCDTEGEPKVCKVDPSTVLTCNDDNPCTDDTCSHSEGSLYTPDDGNDCADELYCNGVEHCVSGACFPGSEPDCNDNNECTDDECDEQMGTCVHLPQNGAPCESGLLCKEGTCDTEGACVGTLKPSFCLIDGVCHTNSEKHTQNPCLECQAGVNSGGWSNVAQGTPCGQAGWVCHEGTCCQPDCAGKNCGENGCGGTCGECVGGVDCVAGVCQTGCAPVCAEPYWVCTDPADCQGVRIEEACIASECVEAQVPDDSGCASGLVLGCSPFATGVCTGEVEQTLPASCPGTCADDSQCGGDVCLEGACEPLLCLLTGTQGQVVDCALHLAGASQASSAAVVMQMKLVFDSSKAEVDSIEVCGELDPPFNMPCTPMGDQCDIFGDPTIYCDPGALTCSQCVAWDPADPDAELATDHSIGTCAQPPPNCETGEFFLLFWGGQSAPLSEAYFSDGLVEGHSEFVNVRFALMADAPVGTPVTGVDFLASDALAQSLQLGVYHPAPPSPSHVIVTGGPE